MRRQPALPTFFIIGAAKCGTTSLHDYLGRHPEIAMSREKEPNYLARGPTLWGNPRPVRTERWYRSLFDGRFPVRGESSVAYSVAPMIGGVPERMARLVPNARIIYLIREHLGRLVSAYAHNLSLGRLSGTLDEELLRLEGHHEAVRGLYHSQLEQYLEFFDRDRILVLKSDDLRHDRLATLARVFEFLGVDPSFRHPSFAAESNRSTQHQVKGRLGHALQTIGNSRLTERIPTATRQRVGRLLYRPFAKTIEIPQPSAEVKSAVGDFYAADTERLRSFIDDPLPGWPPYDPAEV